MEVFAQPLILFVLLNEGNNQFPDSLPYSILHRNDIISPETDKLDDSDNNGDKFSTELALLRERNKSMESELKEMQERYSEISLKFAEVEGERQQLVMTLRSLKNRKKI